MSKFYKGFEISRRAYDGMWQVSDWAWWPDDYLDSDPAANAAWLDATEGWRAKGWIVVHVAPTFRAAHNWIHNLENN